MPALALVLAVAAGIAVLAAVVFLAPPRTTDETRKALPAKTDRAGDAPAPADTVHDAQLADGAHDAPGTPLSVSRAHRIMREHLTCRMDACPRKHAAYTTLRDAGKLVPDPRVTRRGQ